MDILSLDLLWLILGVFTICFLFILLMKGAERFWLPTITIWLFLFFALILANTFTANEVSYQETVQNKNPTVNKEGEVIPSFELEKAKKERTITTSKLFHLLGSHTVFAFIWMLLGYRQTSLKYYRTSAITFAVITIVYLFILVLK